LALVADAVKSGWVSSIGPYIDRFESEFARYCGVSHAVAVSNGTVALHLTLHALGVGPGDEVLVPDLTFVATAHAVLMTGATPVLLDVDEHNWCMSARAVERAITSRTKAIVPVHLYGYPVDVEELKQIVAGRDIRILEDAAEAHGAEKRGLRVGALGDAGIFSFYGNKIMTTGEGGMVVTNDAPLAARVRFLKDHGMSKLRRYYHTELAFNYRMTNLQAALGVAQLEQIEGFIAQKQSIMEWYRKALSDISDLEFNAMPTDGRSVYWMASVLLPEKYSREEVADELGRQNIDTRPFFVPMSECPHLTGMRQVSSDGQRCTVAASVSRRGLNLPSGCRLTQEQVERVADALMVALKRVRTR